MTGAASSRARRAALTSPAGDGPATARHEVVDDERARLRAVERKQRSQPQIALDVGLRQLCADARLLPALTAENAAPERARLVAALERGERPKPAWRLPRVGALRDARLRLDRLRRLADGLPGAALYLARLDELDLDLAILDARGEPKLVRPMAARRFGTGREPAPGQPGQTLRDVAESLLANNPSAPEQKTVPARGNESAATPGSLAGMMRAVSRSAGLDVDVRVSPRLVSNAAAGDRTVFIASRMFGPREARRLAIHEVLGHLVAAFNGRSQPLGLLALGTAGSFGDQEGMCIALEEAAGLLDADRVRMFAARVLVTDWVHEGASYADAATRLMRDHGFGAFDAAVLAERGYRGGGAARDVVYLRGWMRVRQALAAGDATLDLLRVGKVGLDDLRPLEELAAEGWVSLRPPYLPSLARSLAATGAGTSFEMSPPNLQTSFTSPDAT